MQFKNLRIIPLLVFVAMLAFSLRLVDVVTGFSSLSGSAYAESSKDMEKEHGEEQSDKVAQAVEPGSGGLIFADEEEKQEEPKKKEEHDEWEDEDSPVWRDPTDEDPGYEAVRMELFEELSKRRKELEKQEKELRAREALLRAGEKEIDRKYQELAQLRQEIERLLQQQSIEEEERINSLVKIYEGMKPKDAARIFDTLDIDILVSVLGRMSERKLSPIMAAMNPERARTVTIMLAEEKQLPSLPYNN